MTTDLNENTIFHVEKIQKYKLHLLYDAFRVYILLYSVNDEIHPLNDKNNILSFKKNKSIVWTLESKMMTSLKTWFVLVITRLIFDFMLGPFYGYITYFLFRLHDLQL